MKLRHTSAARPSRQATAAAPDHDPSSTGQMIDAAIDNQSTLPLKGSLLRPSRRRKVSAFVSTAIGKVVLCSTVAAASVGGVSLTTDRITLEASPFDQPAATTMLHADPPTPATTPPHADPPTPSTTTAAAPSTTTTAAPVAPATAATTDEPPTGQRGCEFGQATADAASEDRNVPDDHPLRDHDPCDRSATPTPGGPPDRTTSDGSDGNAGNAGENGNGGNRNAGGNGQGGGKPG